jgi:hypothetical protein
MPIQIADDAARSMKRPWLGPAGSWRWPFDATFTQWGVGTALAAVLVVPLWRFMPLGLLAIVAGRWFGRLLGPLVAPERSRMVGWCLSAALWLLLALVNTQPRSWLLPVPGVLAPVLASAVAVLVVRRVGRFINFNRPVSYWLVLPWRAAAGPRPGAPVQIDVSDLEARR